MLHRFPQPVETPPLCRRRRTLPYIHFSIIFKNVFKFKPSQGGYQLRADVATAVTATKKGTKAAQYSLAVISYVNQGLLWRILKRAAV